MNSLRNPPLPDRINDKKTLFGWVMFDWANSAYALVISVALFPAYFSGVTDPVIKVFDFEMTDSTYYSYLTSASYLIVALINPILSGIADYGGWQKYFLKIFTFIGSLACMSLYFFSGMESFMFGSIAFALGLIGFASSLIFYNSFLPRIATKDRQNLLSARGFTYGYIGSVILLVASLLMITFHESLGFANSTTAVRISFVLVGIWWLGFAQITFRLLPADTKNTFPRKMIWQGYNEIYKVWQRIRLRPIVHWFLASFFFYSMGVQTVLLQASLFASLELGFEQNELIIIILILQIVAIGGASLFAWIANKRSNKVSLILMLIIWMIICYLAYLIQDKFLFYLLAAALGMVMGGIQATSRSTFSKMIGNQEKDVAGHFCFYELTEKFAIVLGTFGYGLVQHITGNLRDSLLLLSIFFLIALLIMSPLKLNRAMGS